jgi:PAS domain S-box-containing protein/putative nucleotidyltransferase with HDIG domain
MEHHTMNDYMAHGFCYLWEPRLVWLHVISNILIGMAYFSIPAALFYFLYKRRDLPFLNIFILFGFVFFLCGATHIFAVYTVYVPAYWFEGIVKAVTAVVSVVTAFLFVPLMPKAIALPSLTKALEDIKTLNTTLANQVEELRIKDSAIASSANAISFSNLSGHLTYVNNAFLKLWGYKSKEEVLGKAVSAFLESDEHAADLIETMRKSGSWAGELVAKRSDGKLFPVELTWNMILSDSGNPISLMGLFTDITERRKAEEALRASEARFRALIEKAPVAISISRGGRTIYVNHKYLTLYGFQSLDELVGQPIFDQWAPESREIIRERAQKRARGEPVPSEYEETGQRKDGSRFPAHVVVEIVELPDGPAFMAFLSDISERKKAEAELRLFRNLLDRSHDALFVVDPETGIFLDVNAKACSSLGYGREELLKMNIFDIQSKIPDSFSWKDHVNEVKNKGHMVLEGRNKRKDDSTFPVEVNVSYVSLEKRDYMVGVVRDITERKQAEEELRRSEKKYRDLFDSTLDGIYQTDATGVFTVMNRAGAKIFGYESPEEIIGKNALEYWRDAKDRDVFRAELKVKKTVSTYHIKAKKKTGESIELESSSRIMEDESGNFLGIQGILRDVTERKKMEEEIFRVKQDWEDTFNTITDMITVHDKNFNIIHSNKTAEKMLSLPSLELEKVIKCYRYYHGTECPPTGCPSCQCLQTGKTAAFELFEPHLNMYIEIRAIPRFDSNKQLIGLIHVVRDISERKKTEERIQRHIKRDSALRAIDLAISSSLDIRMTLKIFIEHVVTQLGVDVANVLLLNPHTRILEYAASQGFRTSALKHSHLRLGQGYAGVAALENRIVRIPNLKEEDNVFTRMELLKGEDFITYVGVPLVAKGHVRGVLEIFHRTPLNPDEEWFDFLGALALQAAIAIDNSSLFYDLERSNMDLILAYERTIEGWSRALDYRDKETEGHSQRVTELTINMARELGMNEEELVHVRRGALLHDIGKMGIPDSVLLKPGSLTEEEWKIMRLHPVYSYELLHPIDYLRASLDIPYCHHENWDGSGYPRGLKGEQIPLSARIFAVVDVWDALRSDRPYRRPWTEEKTKEYIRSLSGIQFDPKVVEVFFRTIVEKKDY